VGSTHPTYCILKAPRTRMKTKKTLILICIPLIFLSLAEIALAGEAGLVTCTTPGCDYHTNLKIGGGKRTPSITGYCSKEKKFVYIKLKSWEDYNKPRYCSGGKERLQPIYNGSEVSRIPCPKCGNLTLQYERKFLFD
jgi:hypothetical protein